MDKQPDKQLPDLTPALRGTVQEVLGYLNFSNGTPDSGFERNLNTLWAASDEMDFALLRRLLTSALPALHQTNPVFKDITQVVRVLELSFDHVWPDFRRFHADLFFHVNCDEFQQPLFLARIFEAVLQQQPFSSDPSETSREALEQLNNFIGYRPVAVLENERRMQPYPHEFFPPLPLYLEGAGVARGRYEELITGTLQALERTPRDLLAIAHLDTANIAEIALDLRSHDHNHPVNKRTNYMFGEWDPHQIDIRGNYRRFILRKIILDALQDWMARHAHLPHAEVLYDASAVLCGTMLMASAISGAGPDTHQSEISLSGLLPRVARLRDAYYDHLLTTIEGPRGDRLRKEAKLTQQPFGHVRQSLNLYLAQYGARQVQLRHLAMLLARMGYPQAAREKAEVIPCASIRFESEIQLRLSTALLRLQNRSLDSVRELVIETEDLLHRGIQCGALVDPWNLLGFQGHFPLFSSREDVVMDQRVEILLDLMEQIFEVYTRLLGEASAQGRTELVAEMSGRFEQLGNWWDQFASTTVEDLPKVSGEESWQAATSVARTLAAWQSAGTASGDMAFWREHVDQLQTPKSYALVVESLLQQQDYVAAMALLMQWLSSEDEVELEFGQHSLHQMLVRWMRLVTNDLHNLTPDDLWTATRRLFDHLEVNAGDYWNVPELSLITGRIKAKEGGTPAAEPAEESPYGSDEEDELFKAAYEDVVYRDTTDDGTEGSLSDEGFLPFMNTEFDLIGRALDPRLKFLNTLAQLWQTAGIAIATRWTGEGQPELTEEQQGRVQNWCLQTGKIQRQLIRLMDEIWHHEISTPSGDHDSNVEYDIQLQRKFYLVHTVISTQLSFSTAERYLLSALPVQTAGAHPARDKDKQQLVKVYQQILRRNPSAVRQLLPDLLKKFGKKPLLYIPMENGGEPRQILEVRSLQAVIRFLLAELPRLGLLRETWRVLKKAYEMERSSRPGGIAVTEFDRLFRTALQNTLEAVVRSAEPWKQDGFDAESLVDQVEEVVDYYRNQWRKHSRTMRLSAVEPLFSEVLWEETREFIEEYGSDLFHAKMLTLGNMRAILHNGVSLFLNHLRESLGPYQSMRLLDDLDAGVVEQSEVVEKLEMIYGIVVDKFDRFLEYNTTTTQSDYGEKFYCLLDFLRVEAEYERGSWELIPDRIAHEVLVQQGQTLAAALWEEEFHHRTRENADRHVAGLQRLEKEYGMHLPAMADHLKERFVKPLAVNRMVALVPRAMEDARRLESASPSLAFDTLIDEIDSYLDDVSGSGIDIPDWLRNLEREVEYVETRWRQAIPRKEDGELGLNSVLITEQDLRHQLDHWNDSPAQ